jgi:hypothetical protein
MAVDQREGALQGDDEICIPGTETCAEVRDPQAWQLAAKAIGHEGCREAGDCYFAIMAMCRRAQTAAAIQTVHQHFPETTVLEDQLV